MITVTFVFSDNKTFCKTYDRDIRKSLTATEVAQANIVHCVLKQGIFTSDSFYPPWSIVRVEIGKDDSCDYGGWE